MSRRGLVRRVVSRVVGRRLICGFLASVVTATTLLVLQGCEKGWQPAAPSTGCSDVQRSTEPCSDEPYYLLEFSPLPCPTRAEVEEVQREIPVTIKSDPSAGILQCREKDGSLDLSPLQFRVYRALIFLRQMQFDAPLPWTNLTVWDWLRTTIPKGIVIDSKGESHSCVWCKGPITLSYDPNDHPTNWADWPNVPHSMVDVPWFTIVHEARHAEGYEHSCNLMGSPPVARSDRTIAEMGASGVSYYLSLWLGTHSNEDPRFRQWASQRAHSQRNASTFCCECGGIQPGSVF